MPAPNVIYIPSNRETRKQKAAVYARISTDSTEQEGSLIEQTNYYTEKIKSDPNLEFAGIYADEGISGTQAKTRPELMRMIQDCRDGKIDLIFVKSISRLSRNVADCKRIVDEITELGIEIRFEKEGLSTKNPMMGMIFSMMSLVAENESRSISQNVHWSFVKKAEKGIYTVPDNTTLGYSNVDGVLKPNKDAWMVNFIYDEFLKGKSLQKISNELAAKGGIGIHSGKPLNKKVILGILSNELFAGDKILQKQAPKNYLTHKPDPTIYAQQYLVTDGHEAIIDRDTWNKVQEKLKARKMIEKDTGCIPGPNSHPLYGRIICGDCGSPYKRLKRTYKGETYFEWICKNRKLKTKDDAEKCHNRIIREEDLLQEIKKLLPVKRYKKGQPRPEIWERIREGMKVYVYEDHLEIKE